MRPGTISSQLRGHAEGLVKRMYEQLTRIGVKDEALQNAYALWLIESLKLDKLSEVRLIVDGNDGSKEYREFNGFDAEDASTLAADDSNVAPRYAAQPEPGETAPSLADRAYSQIVAASGRGTADAGDSTQEESNDRYLDELDMLEKEIAEEADLIRRIRDIHMQLRAATSGASKEDVPAAGGEPPTGVGESDS